MVSQCNCLKSKIPLNYTGLLLMLAVLLLSVSVVPAATLEVEYDFERPVIKPVTIDGQVYDRVFLADAPNTGQIGYPALPVRGARILLPYGTEVAGIEIITGERQLVGSQYLIEPVEQPFPLSTPILEIPPLFMENEIYALNSPVPSARFEQVSVQSCRGYKIVVLKLNPTEYVPASGKLYYYPMLRVRITTAQDDSPVSGPRILPADIREVASWIDNPSEMTSYTMASHATAAAYDMLIITLSTFADAFQPLKNYHDTTGVLTEIHTLMQIGANDPNTVRDYIREQYQVNGIQYVLIGADDEIIPALDMYAESFDRPDAPIEYQMPGDFYFSCLDGTFNYDGDALWGEPGDGDGGGEIDLFPEVHVGRVSASSAAEVTNLVNKVLAYAASEEPYLEKVLLAGEQLGFGGMGEYGGYAMEEMVNGSDAHGFTTYGFPSAVYGFDKLYDYTDQPDNYWSPTEILSLINAGQHIVDHLGHSGPGYAMRTDTTMIRTQLTNTQYCFAYAEGCSAGTFDWTDCWAEYITVIMEHGAFGCVANARLGLGARSTAHPVHVMNREFWDAVYDAAEAKPQLGRAMSDARADHAYNIDGPGMRWTIYETTLFGDPALVIKEVRSVAILFPDGAPDQVSPYGSVSFNVAVNGIGLGSPVAGTGQLHYSIDGGEMVTIPMTEGPTNQYEATLPVVLCGSSIDYYVSVQESSGERLYRPDPEAPLSAMSVSDELLIFEDDFETNKDWNISGGLWERGVPLGLGGDEIQYPVPDPTEGCSGPQVLGYNLSGDYENNLPQTPVTSPAIDCSGMENVHLRFCRWLGVERPAYDRASIWVSNNGATWTQVWENDARVVDLEWMDQDYDISAVADNQPTVYIRFNMGPTDPGLRFIGWNIDDVQVVALACRMCLADSDGDGFGDPGHPENECPDDNCPGVYNPSQTDTDADGVGDLCDNCQTVNNPSQEDLNLNEVGDACEGCCGFWAEGGTGNANCSEDGKLTLADVSRIIDHLFISKDALCCYAAGNTNGSWDDGDCKITLSDISKLIDALYISKQPTADCMPECER